MKISTLLSALLMAGAAFSAQDPPADLPEDLKAAHVTFVELCAPCHGVLGDGKGTTELDRPARSFADGGLARWCNAARWPQRTRRSGAWSTFGRGPG